MSLHYYYHFILIQITMLCICTTVLTLENSTFDCGPKIKCSNVENCVHDYQLCDGLDDCADGSDEEPEFCEANQCPSHFTFVCTHGRCLHPQMLCDGKIDCMDAVISDENATTCPGLPIVCPDGQFKCPNTNVCLQPTHLCSGYSECGDGADEENWFCVKNALRNVLANKKMLFVLIGILVLMIGLSGNIITLITILSTKLRQNFINKYIVVLLSTDSLVVLWLLATIFDPSLVTKGFWSCLLSKWVALGTICASSNIVVLLTMERFFAVFWPLQHIQYQYVNRLKLILIFMLPVQLWLFSSLLYTDLTDKMLIWNSDWRSNARCITLNLSHFYIYIPFYGFAIFLPLVVVITVNLAIVTKLFCLKWKRRDRNAAFRSAASKTANNKILVIIPAIFVALTLPVLYAIFNLKNKNSILAWVMKDKFAMLNHLANFYAGDYGFTVDPLLIPYFSLNFVNNWIFYALASSKFRQSFAKFWVRLFRCRRKTRVISVSNSKDSDGRTRETRL